MPSPEDPPLFEVPPLDQWAPDDLTRVGLESALHQARTGTRGDLIAYLRSYGPPSQELYDFLADMLEDKVQRPANRPVKAAMDKRVERYLPNEGPRQVVQLLRAEERRIGKQLRGPERAAVIRDACEHVSSLDPSFQVSPPAVDQYIRKARSKR